MSVDQYYSMAIPSFRLYRLKLTNTNEYAEFYAKIVSTIKDFNIYCLYLSMYRPYTNGVRFTMNVRYFLKTIHFNYEKV